jgi:peptidoglycan/LPS O-acetylase OafA/YrhL
LHPVPGDFFAWDAQIRRITIFHLDATGWGVLAAAVNRWHKAWWLHSAGAKAMAGAAMTIGGLAMIWLLVGPGWGGSSAYAAMNAFSLTLIGAGTFLIMPWLTGLAGRRTVFDQFIEKTSLYSYSIYLCHFPLIFIVKHVASLSRDTGEAVLVACVVVWLALVYALSALVYYRFEKPVSDLRERYTRRVSTMPF